MPLKHSPHNYYFSKNGHLKRFIFKTKLNKKISPESDLVRPGTAGTEKTLSNEKSSLPVAAENGFGPRRGCLKNKLLRYLLLKTFAYIYS